MQSALDRLERPYLQSAAASERPDSQQAWLRPLQAATALRRMLHERRAGSAASGIDDGLNDAAVRRNDLVLLQHHLERLLLSPTADLRAAGKQALILPSPELTQPSLGVIAAMLSSLTFLKDTWAGRSDLSCTMTGVRAGCRLSVVNA